MSWLVFRQQTSANVSSVSYLCCCLQVEAAPIDIALIVEAAVTRASAAATGLSISKTNLWKQVYGPDTEDTKLNSSTGNPVLDAKQLHKLTTISARIPLVVKLFSLCWLAAFRGVGSCLSCARFALALQVAVAFV